MTKFKYFVTTLRQIGFKFEYFRVLGKSKLNGIKSLQTQSSQAKMFCAFLFIRPNDGSKKVDCPFSGVSSNCLDASGCWDMICIRRLVHPEPSCLFNIFPHWHFHKPFPSASGIFWEKFRQTSSVIRFDITTWKNGNSWWPANDYCWKLFLPINHCYPIIAIIAISIIDWTSLIMVNTVFHSVSGWTGLSQFWWQNFRFFFQFFMD